MYIVFVNVRFVKNFGCHYNHSGLLKIAILILARFQNLETPPTKGPSTKDVRQNLGFSNHPPPLVRVCPNFQNHPPSLDVRVRIFQFLHIFIFAH